MELETARLRRWRDADLPTLARWNADPVVMRHMGRGPMTLEESTAALDRYRRHWEAHGFGIWAAGSGSPITALGPTTQSSAG